MKTKIIALSIALILLFSFCVLAQDTEFNISVPSDFTVVHKGDSIEAVAKQLEIQQSELSEYFTQNGMLYLAVSSDSKTQIRLSCFNDNFSSEVGDISRLDSNGLNEFITAIGGDSTATAVNNNDRKFVVIKDTLKDSGGIYTVTQYITIANDKTYYLSCYNDGEATEQRVEDVFKSFSISTKEISVPNYTTHFILIWVGIIVFAAVSVIMIIGIIKAYLKSKKGNGCNE